jgi:hypothetical protein
MARSLVHVQYLGCDASYLVFIYLVCDALLPGRYLRLWDMTGWCNLVQTAQRRVPEDSNQLVVI